MIRQGGIRLHHFAIIVTEALACGRTVRAKDVVSGPTVAHFIGPRTSLVGHDGAWEIAPKGQRIDGFPPPYEDPS